MRLRNSDKPKTYERSQSKNQPRPCLSSSSSRLGELLRSCCPLGRTCSGLTITGMEANSVVLSNCSVKRSDGGLTLFMHDRYSEKFTQDVNRGCEGGDKC